MFKTNQPKETMNYFIKELGNKKEYKLKDVKNWLGY
jgi:hypothetical protein